MAVSAARTRYDGVGAFPAVRVPAQTARQRATQVTVTGLIVVGPFAGLAAGTTCTTPIHLARGTVSIGARLTCRPG